MNTEKYLYVKLCPECNDADHRLDCLECEGRGFIKTKSSQQIERVNLQFCMRLDSLVQMEAEVNKIIAHIDKSGIINDCDPGMSNEFHILTGADRYLKTSSVWAVIERLESEREFNAKFTDDFWLWIYKNCNINSNDQLVFEGKIITVSDLSEQYRMHSIETTLAQKPVR